MNPISNNVENKEGKLLFVFSDFDNSNEYLHILTSLTDRGYSIEIIVVRSPENSFVKALSSLNLRYQLISTSRKISRFLCLLQIIAKTKASPRKIVVSGVEASYLIFFASFILKIRYVLVRHHSNLHFQINNRIAICLDHYVALRSNRIYAVSKSHKAYLVNDEGMDPKKVGVVYGGFHLESFAQNRIKKSSRLIEELRPLQGTTLTFGVCARLVEWKGIQYILFAFEKLIMQGISAELFILGDGPYRKELQNIIDAKLSRHVKFLERVNLVPDFFLSLDVFIHTPIEECSETFGMVYLEALASGIPCIFTMSGILNEMPKIHDSVVVVPFCDSDAIFRSMLLFVEDKRGLNISQYSLKALEYFTLDKLVDRYMGIINQLNSLEK